MTTTKNSPKVNSLQVKNYLLSQEHMLNKAEIGWASDIIRHLNFRKKFTNTLIYFNFLRSKKLKSHQKVARFSMKVFKDNGAQYSEIRKQEIILKQILKSSE